jgi:hypothetical protein
MVFAHRFFLYCAIEHSDKGILIPVLVEYGIGLKKAAQSLQGNGFQQILKKCRSPRLNGITDHLIDASPAFGVDRDQHFGGFIGVAERLVCEVGKPIMNLQHLVNVGSYLKTSSLLIGELHVEPKTQVRNKSIDWRRSAAGRLTKIWLAIWELT